MKWLILGVALLFAHAAFANPETLRSPDGRMQLTVSVNGEGRPEYALARDGQAVIAPSRLGFILADAPKLERNFRITGAERRRGEERYTLPWGERLAMHDRHEELAVTFTETGPNPRTMRARFRLFDDGLGFRIEVPEQPHLAGMRIVEELTEFAVAEPGTAWWTVGGEWNRYEYLYNRTPIAEVSQAHTPLTLVTASGLHLAIHEAALLDYAAMWLRRVEGQRFKAVLSPSATGPSVVRDLPMATPWRVLLVAADAPRLHHAADIILHLNAPSRLPDIRDWFRPHKYAGVWWEMHLDTRSWGTGPRHGATNENVRRHIDFAAANGFRSVLVEGWNPGWDGDWFATGHDFDFTRAVEGFDLEGLAAYARARGVRLMGHHETAANLKVYEPQLEAALDLYERLGIDSVKTGYVADAGGVRTPEDRFEWHDGQVMTRHHMKVVEAAARRRIAVNPHEPVKDTGIRRTWPNWVTREGARGMEYNAWGDPKNPPGHEPTLVFTRMLAGPMDYTPGILSLVGRGNTPIPSTLARQLALYLAIYSPIQMVPDLPENYARFPEAFAFIRLVPADWKDTRMLAGAVGNYMVVARADRESEDWYLGAITDEDARELEIRLDFLAPRRRYEATVWRDAEDADFRTERRFGHVVETRVVRAGEVMRLRLAPGGGQAIRFRPLP